MIITEFDSYVMPFLAIPDISENVNFTLQQAVRAQSGSKYIALLFL